jgi:hypothetical protein
MEGKAPVEPGSAEDLLSIVIEPESGRGLRALSATVSSRAERMRVRECQ